EVNTGSQNPADKERKPRASAALYRNYVKIAPAV
ncbi:MAG: hypothetical protein ACD_64C00091G0005, partial [uncultured bacterium]